MIIFRENVSLRKLHTFRTDGEARYFLEFSVPAELQYFFGDHPSFFKEVLIMGGGSNLLFAGDFPGMVIRPLVTGITVEREDDINVWVRAGAGVVWDDFVQFAVTSGWGGVENLSLIPGSVGAVPVQNIGAYGQEASRVISSVTGIDLRSGEQVEIEAANCRFSYRNSVFKQELKEKFLITFVVFKLDKYPELVLSYGGVEKKAKAPEKLSLASVRDAIISIRKEKLPDPAVLGNAGSFFKNPVVSKKTVKHLLSRFPDMPFYPAGEGEELAKLSAGWLIEQCGWKGIRRGDAGVHTEHALVLVNYGNATGMEIAELSEEIRRSVMTGFGIELDREVNIIGFT